MDERGKGGMDARNILPRCIHSLRVHVAEHACKRDEEDRARLERERGEQGRRRRQAERPKVEGRGPSRETQASPSSISLCAAGRWRGSARDRKLVKSGVQRVERSSRYPLPDL